MGFGVGGLALVPHLLPLPSPQQALLAAALGPAFAFGCTTNLNGARNNFQDMMQPQTFGSGSLALIAQGGFFVGGVGMVAESLPLPPHYQAALAASVNPAFLVGCLAYLNGVRDNLQRAIRPEDLHNFKSNAAQAAAKMAFALGSMSFVANDIHASAQLASLGTYAFAIGCLAFVEGITKDIRNTLRLKPEVNP